MILFVLPGFNGFVPDNNFRFYVKELPKIDIIPLNYVADPVQATIDLIEEIRQFDDPDKVFLGTSLGGFWTQFLADEFNGKSIMLNPAPDPTHALLKYVGLNKNKYTGEEYTLYESEVRMYKSLYIEPGVVKDTLILLNEGDPVINFLQTIHKYIDVAKIEVFNGGDHIFTNIRDTLPLVKDFINYEQI